jgi:DNA polymerase V
MEQPTIISAGSDAAGGVRPELPLPLFLAPVSAGFPSPAEDFLDGTLDLNSYVVKNPAATFFVRAAGDSMVGAGIHSGDVLVVDRSVEARDGRIVIAVLDGELTVKRLRRTKSGGVSLHPENGAYQPIDVRDGTALEIWGVVTAVIHRL